MPTTNEDRDLICQMAAYHCMTIAVLTAAQRDAKPTELLEAEVKRAYVTLVAALHRAGFLERYPHVFEETEPPSDVKH